MFLIDEHWRADPRRAQAARQARARRALHDRARPVPARGELRSAAARRRRPRRRCTRSSTSSSTKARSAAGELGMGVVLMGILPTMRKTTSASTTWCRARATCSSTRSSPALRGGKFEFSIKGLDELITRARLGDARGLQLELPGPPPGRRPTSSRACTTSRSCSPARSWRCRRTRRSCSASGCGPRPASRCSARPSTPASKTHSCARSRRASASARAGSKDSIVEIFREDIARFRALVGTDLDEDPMAMLDRGEIPQLKALRLHNGTIYRWNRAVLRHHRRQAAPPHREPRHAGRPDARSTRSRTPRSGAA